MAEEENIDLAEKLEDFIKKVKEIMDSQEDEIKTLQEENDLVVKHLERNSIIFDVLIEQGYLGIAPSDLTRIKAI